MTALGVGAAIGVVTLLWSQRRLPRQSGVHDRGRRDRRRDHRGRVDVVVVARVRARRRCSARARAAAYVTGFTMLQETRRPTTCAAARSRRSTRSCASACCSRSRSGRSSRAGSTRSSSTRSTATSTIGGVRRRAARRAARVVVRRRWSRSLVGARGAAADAHGRNPAETPTHERDRDVHRRRGRRRRRQEHAGRAARASACASAGREVVVTLEPGDTKTGAELRDAAAARRRDARRARPSSLLMLADRRAARRRGASGPRSTRGAIVVCDRFTPSTLAYQGVGARARRRRGRALCARSRPAASNPTSSSCSTSPTTSPRRAVAGRPRPVRAGGRRLPRARCGPRTASSRRHRGWVLVDASGTPDEVAAPGLGGRRAVVLVGSARHVHRASSVRSVRVETLRARGRAARRTRTCSSGRAAPGSRTRRASSRRC